MPDLLLRRVVLGAGVIALAAGLIAIATMTAAASVKLLLTAALALSGIVELVVITRGNMRCERLRIEAGGTLQVYDRSGACRLARLESGSLVLRRLAWLRFRTTDGRRHAELLCRGRAQSHEWRRLQVIWRHLGAAA